MTSYKSILTIGAVVGLSACGGGAEMAQQQLPSGPLFERGTTTPTTTLPSKERSMTGTVGAGGFIPALTPIIEGGATQGRVAWDGSRLTLIEGAGSKTYDLSAGDGRDYQRGRSIILKGNGDYAAYLVRDHVAAATYVEQTGGSVKLGAFSVGSVTQDMSMAPTSATYNGTMNGQYVGASTTPYDTRQNATLGVDFTGGTFTFTAGSPASYNTITDRRTNGDGLIMTGSGTLNGADFSGTTSNASGNLTGDMSGNFYGPNAEEAGGTVGMTGTSGDFVGAFAVQR